MIKIKYVHSLMKIFLWYISYSERPEGRVSSSRLLLEDPRTSERMKKCQFLNLLEGAYLMGEITNTREFHRNCIRAY